ncbi:MAG: histidinol-phosphate transaminase [Clostridiales bacterium]|nr:histidinol-phosphate transaminase [Clostridiales bacterium]
MAFELNKKVVNLVPYDPICGDYRIRLDANESFILPDEKLMEKIHKAIDEIKYNRYPDPLAKKLCKTFAEFYSIDADFVTACNGSDESISVIMNAFLQKGDKIVNVSPDFSMYKFYSSIVECECITVEKNEDFTFDIDKIIKTANENKARLIIFSNPCNPSSVGCKREEVKRLIKSVDSLVILDEAYMDFWNQSLLDEFNDYDNLIILRTCSKALTMAGIRLGFCVANKTLTNAIRSVKSPYNSNSITQAIGIAVLEEKEYLNACVEKVIKSRDELYSEMKKLEKDFPNMLFSVAPNTNFVYTNFMGKAKDIFEYLKKDGIIVRHMGEYLRITAGTDYENKEVVKGIREYLEKVKA